MLQTLKNAWKTKDIRSKILFTLFILVLYRIGTVIPVPFVDTNNFASIFSGTILDNIKYGRLDATMEEVEAAARAVCAHDFISKMPRGYYSEVNERGSGLSQGQRQLISFARTLLSDPRILILDEATSSIDTQTERLLQQGIAALLKNRTSFLIAHRLSTIKSCDKIMFIGNKTVLECGSHDELMALRGHYYRLYTAQAKEQGVTQL